MPRPLCFVLMPFGSKPNASGTVVDFDAVYGELIAPTVEWHMAGRQALKIGRGGLRPLVQERIEAAGAPLGRRLNIHEEARGGRLEDTHGIVDFFLAGTAGAKRRRNFGDMELLPYQPASVTTDSGKFEKSVTMKWNRQSRQVGMCKLPGCRRVQVAR